MGYLLANTRPGKTSVLMDMVKLLMASSVTLIKHSLLVKYWQQAKDNLMNRPLANGWGEKHSLFVKWKYVESKALILDEGNTEKSHGMAVAALQAADECFKESKKASESQINRDLYTLMKNGGGVTDATKNELLRATTHIRFEEIKKDLTTAIS
ncbi:unnamed protein product [Microthlaspi erraticum]|uniref:Uncharacterized protein n=1 Tax=Microthlaspi erraticum TaxID=1685480 RepID=A0A6D2HR12_9BRAS|nr:unnamed protein product [Microthlaspi erraticum]